MSRRGHSGTITTGYQSGRQECLSAYRSVWRTGTVNYIPNAFARPAARLVCQTRSRAVGLTFDAAKVGALEWFVRWARALAKVIDAFRVETTHFALGTTRAVGLGTRAITALDGARGAVASCKVFSASRVWAFDLWRLALLITAIGIDGTNTRATAKLDGENEVLFFDELVPAYGGWGNAGALKDVLPATTVRAGYHSTRAGAL